MTASGLLAPGRAARLIRGGRLVVFPTETVYGLGADATNAKAVARFFEGLRGLDGAGLDAVAAPFPPADGLGLAIRDRLRRGASGRVTGGCGPLDREVIVQPC